ncbi:toxin HipA [Synergistales bacterium]|nr:toxin HipA [Synergistales bacterium]
MRNNPQGVLNVLYHERQVGRIVLTPENLCAFEYSEDWISGGFAISPFKLPLQKGVFIAKRSPFEGNFGVFNDSLPDGWGRLLIDRMLLKKHIDPAAVSILTRLAIVGNGGMGALEYRPEYPLVSDTMISDLATLAKEAEAIQSERIPDNLEELVQAGGSSGGARPKVLIKFGAEDWLIKFRAGIDPKNIGENEFLYSQAARLAGLDMPETKLFEGKYFGTLRFDRKPNGAKVMMLSASALLDADHRLPALDYNDLLASTLALTRDFGEVEKLFRLMCFNVLSHNRDDHAKNFSFLYDEGKWSLAPAYDLVYAAGLGGEHATAVDGEGRNPTGEHLLRAAAKIGLSPRRANKIIGEVREVVQAKLSRFLKPEISERNSF